MRLSEKRLFFVLFIVASVLLLTAVPAFATNANAGCNQTPYGSTGPGANVTGPYDDTCVPAPSGNGNGGGNATGQPCAGCVGNADEKNPPGQMPGPSDSNAGYECDTNNGIAKTNPAHTGCALAVNPTPTPTPSTPPVVGGTTTEKPTKVLGKTLARTGSPIVVLAIVGMFLIAAGGSFRVGSVRIVKR